MEMEAVTHTHRWTVSRGDSQTTHTIILTDKELIATKSDKWNGQPRVKCVDGRHPPSKTLVGVLPWTCRSERKRPSRQTDGKATLASSLLLGRCEVLRSLRHCMWAQSQGHHIVDRLEERGVERESARRSSLQGRERAIVCQTNIGTDSKTTLGKRLINGVDCIYGLF